MDQFVLYSLYALWIGVGLIYPIYALIKAKETRTFLINNPERLTYVYRVVIITQWIFVSLLALEWWLLNRTIASLGLGFLENWILLGALILFLLLTIGALAYFLDVPLNKMTSLQKKLKDVSFILPKTLTAYRWSIALAITAGICEEILFRGFIYGELINFMSVPFAILVTNLLFALGHTGMKLKNMVGSFLLGLFWSILYYFTGSLWVPIATHIIVDVYSATLMYKLSNRLKNQPVN